MLDAIGGGLLGTGISEVRSVLWVSHLASNFDAEHP